MNIHTIEVIGPPQDSFPLFGVSIVASIETDEPIPIFGTEKTLALIGPQRKKIFKMKGREYTATLHSSILQHRVAGKRWIWELIQAILSKH